MISSPLNLEFRIARLLFAGKASEAEIALTFIGDDSISFVNAELRSDAVLTGVAEHRVEFIESPARSSKRVIKIGLTPAGSGVFPNSQLLITVGSVRGQYAMTCDLDSIAVKDPPPSVSSITIGDRAFWGALIPEGSINLPKFESFNDLVALHFDTTPWQKLNAVWCGFPVVRGLREGFLFAKRFRLIRALGIGGMGTVWLAADSSLKDKQIALKFLPEDVCHDPGAIDDLRDEVLKARELTHDNIVRIYDLVEADGTAAISMEYIDGLTLDAFRRTLPNKIFEVSDVSVVVDPLCDAITYAHLRGIIHHDLKPQNLMLTTTGILKVCDFGLSGSLCETKSKLSTRLQRNTSGTTPYMSPQHLLLGTRAVTDDIYSLGITLYELMTGKPPFVRGDLHHQIAQVKPQSLADRRALLGINGKEIPAAIETLIASCVAKLPNLRPKTVRDIRDAWRLVSISTELGLLEARSSLMTGELSVGTSDPYKQENKSPCKVDSQTLHSRPDTPKPPSPLDHVKVQMSSPSILSSSRHFGIQTTGIARNSGSAGDGGPANKTPKHQPRQKVIISPRSTQPGSTLVSPETIESLPGHTPLQIEPNDSAIGDANNSLDQPNVRTELTAALKRINWRMILPIALVIFVCVCSIAAWRFRNRIADLTSDLKVTAPAMNEPITANVVLPKTSKPIEDVSYWSTRIESVKTLDDLNELETKIKVSPTLLPNQLADLNRFLQNRLTELKPKNESIATADLVPRAPMIEPPALPPATKPKEVVTSEKPIPSEAEIESKVKLIRDLLKANSLVEAGAKIGELPPQDGRAIILDLSSDYNSRLIEWNQAKPELESFAKKLDAAVKIGDATAVEEARKGIEPINRKFGPMVLNTRPDLTPDGLTSKIAEAKAKSEATSKLLSNCETAMKAGQISIVINNLKSLSTLEASLNEKQKATLTVLRDYQSIVVDICTRLVNQGVSADTAGMDESIAKIKDSPATTVRLNWAKNVRAKLFSGDYAGALEAYRELTVSQNDQLVFAKSPDPGWDRLMNSTKELISLHVDYELTIRKDLPVTKGDNEWYAPKGSKASEVKNVVREFQSKMASHPATQNLKCNGRPWKEIFNEASQDGRWSPMTLNAVLAAQHAFHLPASGWLSDDLIQAMGIQNQKRKEVR